MSLENEVNVCKQSIFDKSFNIVINFFYNFYAEKIVVCLIVSRCNMCHSQRFWVQLKK